MPAACCRCRRAPSIVTVINQRSLSPARLVPGILEGCGSWRSACRFEGHGDRRWPKGKRITDMLKFCASALLAMTLIAGSAMSPAIAADAGKADGSLRLDKAATVLTNAYAVEVVELPEMRMENAPERTIMVLLTDRPMPADRRVDDMAAMELAYNGQMRG